MSKKPHSKTEKMTHTPAVLQDLLRSLLQLYMSPRQIPNIYAVYALCLCKSAYKVDMTNFLKIK